MGFATFLPFAVYSSFRALSWVGNTLACVVDWPWPDIHPAPHPLPILNRSGEKIWLKSSWVKIKSFTISHHRQNTLNLGNANLLPITTVLDGEKQRQEVEESCPPPLAAQLGSHIPRSCSSPRGMQRLSVHFLSATPCSPFSLAAGWALQAAAPACHKSQLQPVFSWSWGCFSPILLPVMLDFALDRGASSLRQVLCAGAGWKQPRTDPHLPCSPQLCLLHTPGRAWQKQRLVQSQQVCSDGTS